MVEIFETRRRSEGASPGFFRLATAALLYALALSIPLSGCAAPNPRTAPDPPSEVAAAPPCESCREALPINGWCEPCAVGYVSAIPIPSAIFHEFLDAHGHDIEQWTSPCLDCAEAIETDGFCRHCARGFIGGRLYYTELTWSLARGEVIERSKLSCPACREHATATPGVPRWCPRCDRGLIGNTAFAERERFDRAEKQIDRLNVSLARLPECETCSMTLFAGQPCPDCRRGELEAERAKAQE